MLQSSGYFRDIQCPFLKLGLCERSHCHYQHIKRQHSSSSSSFGSHRSYSTPAPNHSLPVYVPTPVAKLKSVLNHTHESIDKPLPSNVPQYKPTPISELKKRKVKDDNNCDDSLITAKRIKKNSSEVKCNKTDDSAHVIRSDNCDNRVKKMAINKDHDDGNGLIEMIDNESTNVSNDKGMSFDDSMGQSIDSPSSAKTKVRVAHQITNPIAVKPKKLVMSASQVMQKRFQTVQSQSNPQKKNEPQENAAGKTRIAHQPKTSSSSSSINSDSSSSVINQKRIAHKPKTLQRPVISQFGTKIKVPLKVRQSHLNKFIDELIPIYGESEMETAYNRALETEKSIYDRCSSKNLYLSLTANAVKRIRDECLELNRNSASKIVSPNKSPTKLGNYVVSHESNLNGPISGTFSIEKKMKSLKETELTDIELYSMLLKYTMSDDKLKEYGYPREDKSSRGCALLPKPKARNNYESRLRTCARCMKTYTVNDVGMPIKKEKCIYHNGRLWNERFNRSIERKYSCCKNDAGSGGCASNEYHVIDGFDHPDYNKGYVKTLPLKPPPSLNYYGIYALDCEMCYTTLGLELTRVTVTNRHEKVIYETFVKPTNSILDYNSKFSGIKESDLKPITTTLADVQTRLLTFFNDKTILIGHSLESDLKALKLIHDTVIDTAQVFPHKRGLPFKRALRTLTAEYLKEIIQNEVAGHDSKEDAIAAMRLMLMKVREDLKKLQR